MSGTDRRYGLIGNTAIKVPCRACSTSNITLSGEQTIDGVAIVTDDRVLVTAQTSSVDNGIYVADTGAWVRSTDMDGTYDIVTGTLIKVNSGTSNSGFWYVSTTGTPVIGTDAVNFGMASTVLAVVSAFMQTMLDDANAAAARTTLGLGSMALETATSYIANALLTTTGDTIQTTGASTPARLAATANVAAHATTMNLWAARENILTGGVVTITDIADAPYAGAVTWVKMNAAHVWDDGAVFSVQGGADYTAASGDWVRIYATTVSTFEVTVFKKSGISTVTPPFSVAYDSGDQTITAGGALTLAHSLGAAPKIVCIFLHCATAEANYSIGDYVLIDTNYGVASNVGVGVVPDATNVNIRFGSAANVFYVVDKTTGAQAAITPANWKFVVRAYA